MLKLFDNDEQDSDVEIKTNTDYATHYNTWRQKEELNKLKTKYGDVALDDSDVDYSSTSDEEDEDGKGFSEEFEKDFFKTLACLKKKDPRIYDNSTRFFKDEPKNDENTERTKKEKKKDPLTLANYEKKMVAKTGGRFEEDESGSESEEDARARSPTYVEEQRRLKESFHKVLNENEDEENNWGGLFQKRTKTEEELLNEEDEYSKWLKGQKKELEDKEAEQDLEPLKNYWNNPKLDKDEAFLRDFLLNKKYLDNEDKNYFPTYEEIIHDSDEGLSEDEKNIEDQEQFETVYNHRFEEPDTEYIKRYPRTMAHSVRKTDDKRKLKRQEVKERKEEEKKQKQEDLKQLKALKRKEIEEKINKLKEITGNKDLSFQDNDLEEDFDPEEYDRRMQAIFNEQYYAGEEGDQKPEFDDLVEELGPWADNNAPHCEDEDFNMDCDYDANAAKETDKGKKKRNRYDKKGKKKEENELGIEENDEKYGKYMDELYQLDYEDMIGDIPCRFKYREVVPNSFGLSVEEILVAKDRELNRWCSLKKATQHRPEHVEKYDLIAFEKKAANEQLKRKILSSLFEELEEPTEDENIKILKSKMNIDEDIAGNVSEEKKTNKRKISTSLEDGEETQQNKAKGEEKVKPAKKKRKNTPSLNEIEETVTKIKDEDITNEISKEALEKNKMDSLSSNDNETSIISTDQNTKNNISKKKKKRKRKSNNATENKPQAEIKLQEPNNKNTVEGKLSRRQKRNLKKSQEKSQKPENKTDVKIETKKGKRKRKSTEQVNGESPTKKFKQNKNKNSKVDGLDISNSRLEAYGINPKKFKNKLKYKKN